MRDLVKGIRVIVLLFAVIGCGSGAEVDFARSLAVKAPADLVLRGGKIITVDRDFSIREAVAIRDRHFIAVGSNRDMRPFIGPQTRVIELGGRTVVPGLIDSQIHATLAGLSWDAELHWEGVRSLNSALQQIAKAAAIKTPGAWIVVAGGWAPAQFVERRLPTRAELDQLAPNHPVYIQYLREGALLNSAGIVAAGLQRSTPDPAGGNFERDPKTGELTGWLHGVPAWQYVYDKIPPLAFDQLRQSLKNCFQELNRFGITSIADLQEKSVSFTHRRLLGDLARTGELSLRLNFYVSSGNSGEIEDFKRVIEEVKGLPQNDAFRFGGFAVDTAPGSESDDRLSSATGAMITSDGVEKFRRMVAFFAQSGQSFRLEMMGDSAASRLLDVLEQINSRNLLSPLRVGFAGLENTTAETIARVKKLGGGISVQDRSVLAGERTPAKRRQAPPLRTIIESGVPLGAGTDGFQSGSFSPMLALWWLITGRSVDGSVLRDPNENLTRQEALHAYTMGGAWLTHEERRKGSIETGKLADLAVLSGDYLTIADDQIPALESLLTVIGGHVVYAAGPYQRVERK